MEDNGDGFQGWNATQLGIILTIIGGLGVTMNVVAILYFANLKTETENLIYSKMAFINMAVIDCLLSIVISFIQGPAYIWPEKIWGKEVANGETDYSMWCEFCSLFLWWLSDLNLLAVIPLSVLFLLLYAPCLNLSKRNFIITILSCWVIPTVEIAFIITQRILNNLTQKYEPSYSRCVLGGPEIRTLNYNNATVFFALPLSLHLVVWSLIIYFVCRQGNTFYDKQWMKILRTGIIIIVAFTITWLPYFIVVAWKEWRPTKTNAVIYCFLYISVVLNPVIYCMRSMQFNGKTLGTILAETYRSCMCRARTRSLSPSAPAKQPDYSSYDDISNDDDGETEMKTEVRPSKV